MKHARRQEVAYGFVLRWSFLLARIYLVGCIGLAIARVDVGFPTGVITVVGLRLLQRWE